MPLNRVPSPEVQPEIRLGNWTVFELADGRRFFMGEAEGAEERMRTSTPIVRFDKTNMTGVTQSGRIYHLVGDPRPDPLEDFSVRMTAGLMGLDLSSVQVVDIVSATPSLH